jgi:hypothetical protein
MFSDSSKTTYTRQMKNSFSKGFRFYWKKCMSNFCDSLAVYDSVLGSISYKSGAFRVR